MRARRLLHPGARHHAFAAAKVQLAEPEERAAAQEEPARGRDLAERRRLPFSRSIPRGSKSSRRGEIAERAANGALQPDAQGDDARRAVGESAILRAPAGRARTRPSPPADTSAPRCRATRRPSRCSRGTTDIVRTSRTVIARLRGSATRARATRRATTPLPDEPALDLDAREHRRDGLRARPRVPGVSASPSRYSSWTSSPRPRDDDAGDLAIARQLHRRRG